MVNGSAVCTSNDSVQLDIRLPESPVKYCTVTLSDVIHRGKRLEASVFDADAKQARNIIEHGKYPVIFVGGINGLAESYMCERFKRIWVDKSGIPIFQPSSITDIYPIPDGYISHKTKTNIEDLRVHAGQVLMTRSGTIGKIAYVSKTFDRKIFSDDLLRINCDNPMDAGYIYTYFKSTVGNKILLTNSYGAVITHIEPEHLAGVPIPDAPISIKNRINNLISESYKLLDESNALLDQAKSMLMHALHLPDISDFNVPLYKKNTDIDTFSVKLSDMAYRVDASYHVPIVNSIMKHIREHAAFVTKVGDNRISKTVILPSRFKRVYVENGYGVPFFSGRNIRELNPSDKRYLSFTQHDKKIKEELTLVKNMILVTCSGTIGHVALVPKHWDGWAMTHDIIRCVSPLDIVGYVYIWLSSEYANTFMQAKAYGSVVPHIEKEHFLDIPVPLLKDENTQKNINELALKVNQKRYAAYKLEQQALRIMDNEVIFAK